MVQRSKTQLTVLHKQFIASPHEPCKNMGSTACVSGELRREYLCLLDLMQGSALQAMPSYGGEGPQERKTSML